MHSSWLHLPSASALPFTTQPTRSSQLVLSRIHHDNKELVFSTSSSGRTLYDTQPSRCNSFDHQALRVSTNDGEAQDAVSKAIGDDNGRNDLIAPGIYAVFTTLLIFIIYQLRDAIVTTTLGSKALAVVTGALIWDNLIITIGSLFFRNVEENPTKYKILEALSYPRFTLHAVGVPFQCVTIAEMGKVGGVEFLQGDLIQMVIIGVAFVVVSNIHIKNPFRHHHDDNRSTATSSSEEVIEICSTSSFLNFSPGSS